MIWLLSRDPRRQPHLCIADLAAIGLHDAPDPFGGDVAVNATFWVVRGGVNRRFRARRDVCLLVSRSTMLSGLAKS